MVANIFNKISIWIVVIPFALGLINYRQLNHDSKWIFYLVSIALVPQLLTAATDKHTPLLNASYNAYILFEFAILYIIYSNKFSFPVLRSIIRFCALLFGIACSYFFLGFGITLVFFNSLVSIANILFIFWSFLFLKQEYDAEITIIQRQNPFTWYLIGIIIHSTCRISTMALYHYIRDPNNPFLSQLTIIDSIFNIILYLFFSIGLLISRTH